MRLPFGLELIRKKSEDVLSEIVDLERKDLEVMPATKDATAPSKGQVGWAVGTTLFQLGDFPRYNPDALMVKKGRDIYDKMLQDDQVKACTQFKRDAVTSRRWFFDKKTSDDGGFDAEHERMEKFFKSIIDQMEMPFKDTLDAILTGMRTGFSINEKVHKQIKFEDRVYWGLKKIVLLPFHTFDGGIVARQGTSDVVEFRQIVGGRQVTKIPRDKVIFFVHQPDVDPLYGESDLKAAYRSYWSKDIAIKFQNIHLERHAGGFVTANVKDAAVLTNQKTRDDLKASLENISALTAILAPAGVDISLVAPARTDAYDRAIAGYDKAIAKSLLVPNLLGLSEQGDTGSYSQSQTQFEVFFWIVDKIVGRLEDALNRQLFGPIADVNFGTDDYPKFRFEPLTDTQKREIAKAWGQLVGQSAVTHTEVDENHTRKLLGYPEMPEGTQIAQPPMKPTDQSSGPGQPDAGKDKEPGWENPARELHVHTGDVHNYYDPDQPRDESGKWGEGGGGSSHFRDAVGFDKSPWDYSKFKNAPDLRKDIMDVSDAKKIREQLKEQGRLNEDGRTVTLYHVTDADNIDDIMLHGLIPGKSEAPGQMWKAEHSDYAIYFHQDRSVAERDVEQAGKGFTIVEANILITPKSLIRFLPDEDVSLNVHDGIKTLLEGGPVAYIGGVPPSALKNKKYKVCEQHIHSHSSDTGNQSSWLKRVDFAALKQNLDTHDTKFSQQLADVMMRAKKAIWDQVARFAGDRSWGSVDPASIGDLGRMPQPLAAELRSTIREHLHEILNTNYELAKKELPEQARKFKEIRPGMDKTQAERFLSSKAMKIAGVLDQDVLAAVQRELENAIKYDKNLRDTIGSLEEDTDLVAMLPRYDAGGRAVNVPARLENIARTNDADAMNQARMALFGEPEFKDFIQAYEYSAILDDRTTDICAALDGDIRRDWGSYTPPNHFQCRSLLVPVTTVDDWDGVQDKIPASVKPQKGFYGERKEFFDPDQMRAPDGKWISAGGGDITAYHGTMKSRLDSIVKSGIQSGKAKRSFPDFKNPYKEDEIGLYEGLRGKSVYVTNTFKSAAWYARQVSDANPIVVQVRIPKSEWNKFHKDTQHQGKGAAFAEMKIKPAWIVRADTVDRWMPGSKGKQVYEDYEEIWLVVEGSEE